ncbi:hypothetical protein KKD04_02690, partial [Patescibacteria group bacterium]|nr:hypothetical protein [Patescibacteria group bacterium]
MKNKYFLVVLLLAGMIVSPMVFAETTASSTVEQLQAMIQQLQLQIQQLQTNIQNLHQAQEEVKQSK